MRPFALDPREGERIHVLKKEQGITLQKLAERTRLSKGLLSKVENGKVRTPVSTLFNIIRALRAKVTNSLTTRKRILPSFLSAGESENTMEKQIPSVLLLIIHMRL